MKYIISIINAIIYIALMCALLGYTMGAVNSADICRTIFGCLGLWIWYDINKKEK